MASQRLVWDVHHHWVNETGYIDRLLGEMDRLGIEKTGLIAMGDIFPDLFLRHPPRMGCVDNADVAQVVREHPDRFWGWGYLRLGDCVPEDVDRMADMGMAGLKLTIPRKPYGEPEYFPIYERAEALGLPCLCHTGILYPPHPMPGKGEPQINIQRLKEVRAITDIPLVLHGCTGMPEATVKECISIGMAKINFGTMLRNNFLTYFDEAYNHTDHQGHPWRCRQYVKDKLKDDVRWILSLTGSEGKA